MPKFSQLMSTFQAGEVSERLRGRSDVREYFQALIESRNTNHLPQGGLRRRAGSAHKSLTSIASAEYRDATKTFKKIPFETTDGKKFLLILSDRDCDEWVYVNTFTGEIRSVSAMLLVNSAWTAADVKAVQYAQSGDYVGIVSPLKRPLAFLWDGTTMSLGFHWQVFPGSNDYYKRQPMLEPQAGDANGQGSLTATLVGGSTYTLTSSAGIFKSGHVGAHFKLNYGSASAFFSVSVYTDPNTMTVILIAGAASSGTAVGITTGTSWEEEAWSEYRGYPVGIAFFEQRLCYLGTRTHPNRGFCSQVGDIDELMYRPLEQDPIFTDYLNDNTRAFSFDVNANEPNLGRWLASGKKLFIGTNKREFYAGGTQGAMGPLNIDVKGTTAFGSEAAQPLRLSTSAIFIHRIGQRIRDLTFSFDEEDYKSQDLTQLAEHLTRRSYEKWSNIEELPRFTRLQITTSPFPVLWAIDDAGGLFSCTHDKDTNVLAWSHHRLGGKLTITAVDYAPKVLDIAALSALNLSDQDIEDRIWLTVKRTIDGVDTITLESIGYGFNGISWAQCGADFANKFMYVDCAYANGTGGAASANWTIPHLPNTELRVVGDGEDLGNYTTNGAGEITLADPVVDLIAGLEYTHRVETVSINPPSPIGSGKALIGKIHELFIGFYKSFNCNVAAKVDGVESAQVHTLPTTPFTGDQKVHLPGYGRDYRLVFEDDAPLPWELSYLVAEGQSYD